jgi:hypothetical protein
MYSYKGRLITIGETMNKTRFSQEAINDILDKQPSVPVLINFVGDPIGNVTGFSIEDGALICEFQLRQPNMEKLHLFIVPGGKCDVQDLKQDENGITVIEKMDLFSVSITSTPADPTLTKIENT